MHERSTTIVIAGMHRSGTSLVASALERLGVQIGEHLVPADPRNARGYFEDVEFLEFQRRILQESSPSDDGGHPDWGWTPREQLDSRAFARYRERARSLAHSRSTRFRYWGWKDPRTTLLLDFWDEILADARYILTYRYPWEVADSMQRTGEEVFLSHPEWALPIWTFYNRRLIDFYQRHAGRCLLISANALPGGFPRVTGLVREKLGIPVPEAAADDPYESDLFRTAGSLDPIVDLTAAIAPGTARLLDQLDEWADLPSPRSGAPSRRGTLRFVRSDESEPARPATVSVVIPCFNDRDFLVDAVASVERNATDDCELIVVNDGSTERRTLEILDSLRALGYEVLDQANAGLSSARNTGMRRATGRYVLPLDADNRIRPGFIRSAVNHLDGHAVTGVVFGDRELIGWRTGPVCVAPFDLAAVLRSNYIDACAVFRREVWESCGGYDSHLTGLEDWEFWIAAARRGWHFHHMDAITFDYRVRPGSLVEASLQPKVLRRLLDHIFRKHEEVFREHLPRPLRWAARRGLRAVNRVYWHLEWSLRARGWRRYRRDLGRRPAKHGEGA